MRIMQLYRIENDYKNHKRRLQSIQKLDSKEKVAKVTSQHFYVSNQHKKIKINSQIFREKEELSKRQHSNELMNRTITQYSKRIRQQYESSLLGLNTSKPRSNDKQKIELENFKLREKIGKMKSVYKQTRKNSQIGIGGIATERQRARLNQKQKLVRLLKTQFKIQPVVSFPRGKSKTNANQTEGEEHLKREEKSIQQNSSMKNLQV